MSRRPARATRLIDDTLVVGLVMIAAAAVILYLSFQAQTGLPWKATQRVELAVPDAGKLARNADVRIGGARVGQVLSATAVNPRGDQPAHAILDVQLDASAAPLPADSTVEVRLSSVLGGKYVSIVPGESEQTIPDGGRLGLASASAGVDIEDALGVFGPEGREALRAMLDELGNSVAGRGEAINTTIGDGARMLPGLRRVLATLVAPETDLPGLLTGASAAAGALAAAPETLAALVADTSTTFGALDAAGGALGEGIEELPRLAADAGPALRALRPVLDDAAAIARDLRPAGRVIGPALSEVDATMRIALRVDPKVATLARPVGRALDAVDALAAEPASVNTLRLLGTTDLATFGTSAFVGLGAILATTWEAEEHCRTVSTWVERLRAVASDGDEGGNWLRMIPFFEPNQFVPQARPAANAHANPYPNQNAQECEAGNEGYASGQLLTNPPGLQGAPGGGG